MNNELISEIANLALTFSFVVAVIFGITQSRAASRNSKERFTLETLRNFQTRGFAELMFYMNSNELPVDRKGMEALPKDEQVFILQFSQQMESLGILVAEKLVDIDLVDKTLGVFVIKTWEKYRQMFLNMRKNNPDPFLGEYFQWLAENIEERMKKKPREPFYNHDMVK
ncbi:MAG: hypothetical protein QM737_15740 [Ferruginibacter sp.]